MGSNAVAIKCTLAIYFILLLRFKLYSILGKILSSVFFIWTSYVMDTIEINDVITQLFIVSVHVAGVKLCCKYVYLSVALA